MNKFKHINLNFEKNYSICSTQKSSIAKSSSIREKTSKLPNHTPNVEHASSFTQYRDPNRILSQKVKQNNVEGTNPLFRIFADNNQPTDLSRDLITTTGGKQHNTGHKAPLINDFSNNQQSDLGKFKHPSFVKYRDPNIKKNKTLQNNKEPRKETNPLFRIFSKHNRSATSEKKFLSDGNMNCGSGSSIQTKNSGLLKNNTSSNNLKIFGTAQTSNLLKEGQNSLNLTRYEMFPNLESCGMDYVKTINKNSSNVHNLLCYCKLCKCHFGKKALIAHCKGKNHRIKYNFLKNRTSNDKFSSKNKISQLKKTTNENNRIQGEDRPSIDNIESNNGIKLVSIASERASTLLELEPS